MNRWETVEQTNKEAARPLFLISNWYEGRKPKNRKSDILIFRYLELLDHAASAQYADVR